MNQNLFTISLLISLFSAPLAANQQNVPAALQTIEGHNPDDVDNIELYVDLDEDTVKDQFDHCQNSGQGYQVDRYGCQKDSDGDGIFDNIDQCPNTPANAKVNFLGCEGDADKDSVLDSQDQCPNTPLGSQVNAAGCKLEDDLDKDGVPNSLDQCPDTPAGSKVNEYGCVPRAKVVINVNFVSDSANIPSHQKANLDRDASKLKKLRADEIILITGHTDSQGSALRNMKLSWARAQSVKNYAVQNLGMPAEQIYLLGKGETEPVDTNATTEGRRQNRRIEFNIINLKNLPKSAQLEAPAEMTWVQR